MDSWAGQRENTRAAAAASAGGGRRTLRRPNRRESITIFAVVVGALLILATFFELGMITIGPQPSNRSGGGNWSAFNYDYNNSRDNPQVTTGPSAPPLKYLFQSSGAVTGTPVVYGDNVYFGDWLGNIYSYSLRSGSLNWKMNIGASISSSFAIENNILYVAVGPEDQTAVYAIFANNGTMFWDAKLKTTGTSIWASPVIYDGFLYIGIASNGSSAEQSNASIFGELLAMNATSGVIGWRFATGTVLSGGGDSVWSSVAIDPHLDSIYFGTGEPFAVANFAGSTYPYSMISLNAKTGLLNWNYSLFRSKAAGGDNDFGSSPNLFTIELGGNTVPAVGELNKNGTYVILNRVSGQFIESIDTLKNREPTCCYNGNVAVPALYYSNGNFSDPEIFIPSTDIYNSTCCPGELIAYLPATGSVAWTFALRSNYLYGSVAASSGLVFVGDSSGTLYALSEQTGSLQFTESVKGQIWGGISIAGGDIFVPVQNGTANAGAGVYVF